MTLPVVLLEGVFGGHDDIPTDRTEMSGRFEQPVDFDDVSVVPAELIEELEATLDLAFDFLHDTVVSLVGLLAGEFLKLNFIHEVSTKEVKNLRIDRRNIRTLAVQRRCARDS